MSERFFDRLESIEARVRVREHVLLAMDFDGTLAPVCESPADAHIPAPTRSILRKLADESGAWIAVISGRPIEDLRARVGLNVFYAGNHGFEISGPGISFRYEGACALENCVREACAELAARLKGIPGVFVEDKRLTATVHFRQAPASAISQVHQFVDRTMSRHSELLALPAHRAWEILPRLAWNKGCAASTILKSLRVLQPLMIAIGDDETDEDMFDLPECISIKVRYSHLTRAQYYVDSAGEVRDALALIHRWIDRTALREQGRFRMPGSKVFSGSRCRHAAQ